MKLIYSKKKKLDIHLTKTNIQKQNLIKKNLYKQKPNIFTLYCIW